MKLIYSKSTIYMTAFDCYREPGPLSTPEKAVICKIFLCYVYILFVYVLSAYGCT